MHARAASGPTAGPNSSMAITEAASGVFAASATSEMMGPLAEEMQVVVAQNGRKAARSFARCDLAAGVDDPQPIGKGLLPLRKQSLEESVGMDSLHLAGRLSVGDDLGHSGAGEERAHRDRGTAMGLHAVGTKDGEWVAVLAADDGGEVGRGAVSSLQQSREAPRDPLHPRRASDPRRYRLDRAGAAPGRGRTPASFRYR